METRPLFKPGEAGRCSTKLERTDEAHNAYSEALQIRETLADQDISNLSARHELSTVLEKLGNLYLFQDKIQDAVRSYTESLKIREELANREPGSAEWQKGLAQVLEQLGEIAQKQGQTDLAKQHYQRSLEIRQTLTIPTERRAIRVKTSSSFRDSLTLSLSRQLRLRKTPSRVREEAAARASTASGRFPAGDSSPFLLRGSRLQAFGVFRFSLLGADEKSAHKGISDARCQRVRGVQKFIRLAPECTSLGRRRAEDVAKIIVNLVKPLVRRSKKVPCLIDQQARLGD